MRAKDKFVRFLKHRYVKILSYSGKGGTGKTLTALNLSGRFARDGFNVGLIDIDLEMNSVARCMGYQGKRVSRAGKRRVLLPETHKDYPNLKMFSLSLMPFFSEDDDGETIFWGGEYQREYIFQMIFDVAWGDLDVMVFDLPAGISDAIIALTNIYKTIDFCVVTGLNNKTSTDGISKAITTCKENKIEVLGVIANQGYYRCPHCHEISHPLGKGQVKATCKKYKVEYGGAVPLSAKICRGMDEGTPFVVSPTYDYLYQKVLTERPKLAKRQRELQRRAARGK